MMMAAESRRHSRGSRSPGAAPEPEPEFEPVSRMVDSHPPSPPETFLPQTHY